MTLPVIDPNAEATTELAPGVDPENPQTFSANQLAEATVFIPGQPEQAAQEAAPAPGADTQQKMMLAAIDALAAKGVSQDTIAAMRQKAGFGGNGQQVVEKTQTDPVVLLQPYSAPSDFAAQYPQPLDPTEILTECEEINVWKALPEKVTPFNADQWREMTDLDFATAAGLANDGFFQKGGCPDRITASGENISVTRMYIGASQTLAFEDITHSAAVAAVKWLGISRLLHVQAGGPSVIDVVRDAKAKEIKKQEIIVLNNWDLALVKGNSAVNTLAFDGMETQVTAANGARVNADTSGTFDVEEFDNFLVAGCVRPTHIFGHPKALEAIKKGYMALAAVGGTQPVQQVVLSQTNGTVVPGITLADKVNTTVGPITLVPDFRFTATQVADHAFDSTVYALRMRHDGEDIVYKSTQTPLVFKDLSPGCTAISFMVYAVTSLVIKHMCAQAAWTSQFVGIVGTGCNVVAGTAIGT
jgi:hypothetical protein